MPTVNYNQTVSIATTLLTNVIAIMLAKGAISSSTADSLTQNAATIGAIIMFLVVNGALVIGNQWHRLRYGPVPSLATVAPAVQLASFPGQPSPSYGPPSTGNTPVSDPGDVPPEVI